MVTEAAVLDALRTVRDPLVDRDVVTAKFIKDLKIDGSRVTFTVEQALFGASTRKQVGEDAGAAVAKVAGVSKVDVTVTARVRFRVAAPGIRPTVVDARIRIQ